jgi:uncharacterized protein YjbJ (UPF0337 family)
MPDDAYEHVHCFPIRSGRPLRPEEGLAVAVLEDAFKTLRRYAVTDDRAARRLVAEVDRWFFCNDTDHPFTFVSICDVLALDVAYVRSGLRRLLESRHVTLRTEPRVLHFRRPAAARRTSSSGAPSSGPDHLARRTAGGSGRTALPPAPTPQPAASRVAERGRGTIDTMTARVKEAAVALVVDNRLKQEGKGDQLVGKAKDIAEKMIDTAKNVAKGR